MTLGSHPPKTLLSLVEQRPNQLVVGWRNFQVVDFPSRIKAKMTLVDIRRQRGEHLLAIEKKHKPIRGGFVTLFGNITKKSKIPVFQQETGFLSALRVWRIRRGILHKPCQACHPEGSISLCSEIFFCVSSELHLPCCG